MASSFIVRFYQPLFIYVYHMIMYMNTHIFIYEFMHSKHLILSTYNLLN